MKSGYKNSEARELLRSPTPRQVEDCVVVSVRVRPAAGFTTKDAALSILMALTLRSRRRPEGPGRQAILENSGWIFDLDPGTGRFKLALTERNFPVPNDLSHALTLAFAPVEYAYTEEYWIEWIDLPAKVKRSLQGPRLGVAGVRDLFPKSGARKPLLGFTLSAPDNAWKESGQMLREVITGGVDFIADDLFDLVGSDAESAFARADWILGHVDSTRGARAVPYFANVSSHSLMKPELIERLLGRGVKGFIINPFSSSWDLAAEFSSLVDGRAAVIHSNMGSGVLSRQVEANPSATTLRTGVHEAVTSMLSRATGADAVHAGTVGAECFDMDWHAPIEALVTPLPDFRPCFRVAEGDVTPVNYFANLSRLGTDLLIEANSAIYGHPKGPKAGAAAFRRTIDVLHEDIETAAEARSLLVRQNNPDLTTALTYFAEQPNSEGNA